MKAKSFRAPPGEEWSPGVLALMALVLALRAGATRRDTVAQCLERLARYVGVKGTPLDEAAERLGLHYSYRLKRHCDWETFMAAEGLQFLA